MSLGVREIPLTCGFVALVDADDYTDLQQFTWAVTIRNGDRRSAYARRSVRLPNGLWTSERMHRRLLPGIPLIDHINGDGLDNRRSNLRPATQAQNMRNRSGLTISNKSGFRGVAWHAPRRKWRAEIRVNGKKQHLGLFESAEEAARAFDAAAIEHFGEFHGYLNFPQAVAS